MALLTTLFGSLMSPNKRALVGQACTQAGPGAVFTANAFVVIDQHDAVLHTLVARAGGADRHTGRVFAMQAALGEMDSVRAREFTGLVGLDPVEKSTRGVGAIGVQIGQRTGAARCVPLLARGHASLAAHAHIQVNHQG